VTGWLLDTHVSSELRRPRPNARLRALVAAQALEDLFVSTVTFAEMRHAIEKIGDPIRRAEPRQYFLHPDEISRGQCLCHFGLSSRSRVRATLPYFFPGMPGQTTA
jgi:hypothetical protein